MLSQLSFVFKNDTTGTVLGNEPDVLETKEFITELLKKKNVLRHGVIRQLYSSILLRN